jgi:hypothetical protein
VRMCVCGGGAPLRVALRFGLGDRDNQDLQLAAV